MSKTKTIYQQNALRFEHFCVKKHEETYGQYTIHWSKISDDILLEIGFITNFHSHRQNRKECLERKKNYIQEYGLDGIAYDEEEKSYNGLQFKNWNPVYSINANELGTFLSCLNYRIKQIYPKAKGYIYHTCKVSRDFRIDSLNSRGILNLIKVDDFVQSTSEENVLVEEVKEESVANEIYYELFDYQKVGLEKLNSDWSGVNLIQMPCGTGKTVLLGNYLKNQSYKFIFIVSPFKNLVNQNLERLGRFLPDYEKLLFDSDSKGTTDFNVILDKLNNKLIVSTTYDSFENCFSEFFDEDLESFDDFESDNDIGLEDDENSEEEDYSEDEKTDYEKIKFVWKEEYAHVRDNSLLIIDECHQIYNREKIQKLVRANSRGLLVTATPPNNLLETLDANMLYYYPMREAIDNGYICDYEVFLPIIELKDGVSKALMDIPDEFLHLDEDLTKKALYIINGMLKKGGKKCIVYLRSVEECSQFNKIVVEVMEKYHFYPVKTFEMTLHTKQADRNKVLNDFEKDYGEALCFLSSIRILDEGIDIRKCDSVFITSLSDKTDTKRVVQRMCRANRKDWENKNKVCLCFLWTDDQNSIVSALSLLRENDIDFHSKIRVLGNNYDRQEELKEVVDVKRVELEKFIEVKCVSYKEIFEKKINNLLEFVEREGRVPKCKDIVETDGDDFLVGFFWVSLKKKFKNRSSDRLKNLYDKICTNPILKYYLDIYIKNSLEKKNFEKISYEQKIDILIQQKVLPKEKDIYEFEKIKFDISGFWQNVRNKFRNGINCSNNKLYDKICVNDILKNNLEIFIKKSFEKKDNKDIDNFSSKEKFDILIEQKSLPKAKDIYESNKKQYSIGYYWVDLKQKFKSGITEINRKLYNKISTNKILKENLDLYIKNSFERKDDEEFSFDEKVDILVQQKVLPKLKDVYELNKKRFCIGSFFYTTLRQKFEDGLNEKNQELYNKISQNKVVKKSIDNYIKNLFEKRDIEGLTYNKKIDILTEQKVLPKQKDIYELNNKQYTIGIFWKYLKEKFKYGITETNKELYNKISTNPILEEDLHKYMKKNLEEFTIKEKLDILIQQKVLPKSKDIYKFNNKQFQIGLCWKYLKEKFKYGITETNKELYNKISINLVLKKSIDDYIEKK